MPLYLYILIGIAALWLLISFIVYFVVLVVLFKNRKVDPFNSTYFELFRFTGYLDLLIIVYIAVYVLLPQVFTPWGAYMMTADGGKSTAVKVGMLCAWMALDAQQLFVIVTAVNRFSAICRPLRYTQMWSSYLVRLLSAGCVISAIFLHAPQWTYKIAASNNNNTGIIEMFHYDDRERKFAYGFGAARFAFYASVTAVLYCVVVIKIFKVKQKSARRSTAPAIATRDGATGRVSRTTSTADRREQKLAMSSMVVFSCQVLLVAYMGLAVVLNQNKGPIKYFYYSSDILLTTVNPYALLALSGFTRRMVLKELGFSKQTAETVVLDIEMK